MKTIKYINILNCIYVIICILSILGSSMNLLQYSFDETNVMLVLMCEALFPIGPIGAIIATLIPFGPIACIVGSIHALLNRKKANYQREVGRKWVWLIIWPVLDILLWLGAVCTLVYFTGGV